MGFVGDATQGLGEVTGTARYQFRGRDVDKNSFVNKHQDEDRDRLLAGLDSVQDRQAPLVGDAPNMGPAAQSAAVNGQYAVGAANMGRGVEAGYTNLDTGLSGQARDRSMDLADQLRATAAGQGPSLGTQMIQQGTDQAVAGQIAAARAGRGNPALVSRTAADNTVKLVQDAETQAAQQKMKEAEGAQNTLAGVLGTTRGQDIGEASTEAQLAQEVNLQNARQLQEATRNNAEFQQAAVLANQGNYMQAAQLLQNNTQFNASAQNAMKQAQATLQLQAQQGDQDAQLRLTELNDLMTQYYTTGVNGLDQQQVANLMAYEQMQTDNVNTQQAIKAKAFSDQQARVADLRKDMMKAASGGMMG